jgi:hypothetical protein
MLQGAVSNIVFLNGKLGTGLPHFSWYKHTKMEKYTKWLQTIPNGHKLYQMVVNYSKWWQSMTTFSSPRPSKFYPNWDFWFENKPSGNPGWEFEKLRITFFSVKNSLHLIRFRVAVFANWIWGAWKLNPFQNTKTELCLELVEKVCPKFFR